jgi:hypothetical protein
MGGDGASVAEQAPAPVPPAVQQQTQEARTEQSAAPQPARPVAAPAPVAVAHPAPAPAPVRPPTPHAPPPPVAPLVVVNPQQVKFVAQQGNNLDKALDELHEQVTHEKSVIRLMAGSASFMSLGLSVVYILWTIRAGYFIASLLSSMPAWQFVDPLPILEDGNLFTKRRTTGGGGRGPGDDEDGESLESLVNAGSHAANAGSVTP